MLYTTILWETRVYNFSRKTRIVQYSNTKKTRPLIKILSWPRGSKFQTLLWLRYTALKKTDTVLRGGGSRSMGRKSGSSYPACYGRSKVSRYPKFITTPPPTPSRSISPFPSIDVCQHPNPRLLVAGLEVSWDVPIQRYSYFLI